MISWVFFCFSEKESTANNHSTRSTLPCVVGVCVDCPVKDWEFEVIKIFQNTPHLWGINLFGFVRLLTEQLKWPVYIIS